MKKRIVSLLIAISLIILTGFQTVAQPDINMYNNLEGGEAPTQHPEDDTLELAATPSTTEASADEQPAAEPPEQTPDAASLEQEGIITFNIGGDGTVAKFVADNHILMLRGDSRLIGWGHNLYGQLGLGPSAPEIVYEPTEITFFKDNGLTPIDIAVCEDASFVICSNGETYSTGKGTNGRTGLSHTNNVKTWTLIPGSQALRFSKLHTGKEFIIAETEYNELYAWGRNNKGQLGTGDKIDAKSPVKIMDNANVDKLNLGEDFVTLLKTDKTYWAWGNNDGGRYGFDTSSIAPSSEMLANAACSPTTQACSDGGTRHMLNCIGIWSSYSQYGGIKGNSLIGTTKMQVTPTKIIEGAGRTFSDVATIFEITPNGTANGITNNIFKFSSTSTCAHTHSWTSCTSHSYYNVCVPGAQSVPSISSSSTVTATWQYVLPNAFEYFDTGKIHDLQIGNRHGLVDINGTYYGWGDNTVTQQGTSGDANGYMVPLTQINAFIKNLDDTGGGFNHLKVAGDTNFILSSDGKPYSWGSNTNGKAGQGSVTYLDTPTLITSLAGKSIASIVDGRSTTFYISHNGDLFTSGDNLYGQTGLGEAQKNTSKITTPTIIDNIKFSATELPPSAPDSLDTPNEVETEQQLNIQWSKVSNASAYILTKVHTPAQSAYGIMTVGEEETEIVYIGSDNNITDIAPSVAGEMEYYLKAINGYGDYSKPITSVVNVLDNGSGGNNNNNGNNDNNNNGNNNSSGGLTNDELLQLIAVLRSNGIDEDLITALIASNRRSSSGDVNINIPASESGNDAGQLTPATNIYNQLPDLSSFLEYFGTSGIGEIESAEENLNYMEALELYVKLEQLKTAWSNFNTQPTNMAAQPEQIYYPQQQDNGKQRFINIAIISAILLLILIGCAVKFIPEASETEPDKSK